MNTVEETSSKSRSRDNSPVRLLQSDAKIPKEFYSRRIFRYQLVGNCLHWGIEVRPVFSIHGHGTRAQMELCVTTFLEKNKALTPWVQVGTGFVPREKVDIQQAIVTAANGELEFTFNVKDSPLSNVAPFLDSRILTE